PVLGEAQFYDSLLLCSFAAAGCFRNESGGDADAFANEKVNEELRKMNAAASGSEYAWNLVGMIVALKSLDREIYTNLCGATGLLDFDSETLTSALYSVYVHWGVVEGKFVPLEFTSTDGSSHSSENRASWEWIASFDDNEDIMESENSSVTYDEPASDQWAVIVAASTGWANYRHQADALHFYQLLRKNHFPDDHIILIIADDIANYKRNKHPGEIFARLDGENLYTDDLEIDYLLEELTVEELSEIMQGKSIELPERENLCSQHLKLVDSPTILESRDSSNIIWFWSGHGTNVNGDSENGYFVWEGKPSEKGYRGFTTGLMSETLEAMDSDEEGNKHFRQLLILTETCYSGSVMHICDGIEGVLAFTAANGSETSLADLYSVELKVWLSNRFTKNLTDKISETPGIFYADLYKYLTRNTLGSHVRLFNGLKFGNLYENSPKELVVYAEE
ncbi:MAG: hypothetical protein IJ727_02115, partial [Treponema sp.]|nr:hypothetical protein [Treponema sp.]